MVRLATAVHECFTVEVSLAESVSFRSEVHRVRLVCFEVEVSCLGQVRVMRNAVHMWF